MRHPGRDRWARAVLAVLLTLLAAAPLTGAVKGLSRKAIAKRMVTLLNQGENAQALWGVSVMDLEAGTRILGFNDQRMFLPASTLKLITGYAAWSAFGPDYRFRTEILTDGAVDSQGVLQGNLIVRGGGDPSWSYRFYENDFDKPIQLFVDELLRQANLRGVQGDVVADDTAFLWEPYSPAWTWEDFQWAYGARVTALGFNDNVMGMDVIPGAAGQPVTWKTWPGFLAGQVRSTAVARPGTASNDLVTFKPFDTDVFHLDGAIPPAGGAVFLKWALSDPAEVAGRWIAEELGRRGVTVSGTVRVEHRFHYMPAPAPRTGLRTLAVVEGQTLSRILEVTMKKSINPYAEMLLRSLGTPPANGTGSEREAGIARIYGLWPELLDPGQNILMQDGSGLSRQNLVTPRLMTGMLARIQKSPDFDAFRDLLPASGVDGTMRNRLGGRITGRVYAKTGRLGQVVTIAGYLNTASGRWLAFCIVANNHPARKINPNVTIDAITKLLYRY